MAITEYLNNQGIKNFAVYVNIRSKTMPHIRFQKRVKGLKSRSEAMRQERLLIKRLTSKVAVREGHGLTWRMIVLKWESFARESNFLERPYNPATIKDYVGMMYNWTVDWLDRPAAEITRGDGREVLDAVISKGKSKSFQKRLKNTINMIFNWAIEERLVRGVHNSPVFGLKIILKYDKKPEILKKNEIIHLLNKADESNHEWFSIWAVALLTGMRNGELYALKWSDVDLSTMQITVQRSFNRRTGEFKSTKAGYWRNVPISSSLKKILLSLDRSRGGFVLPRLVEWRKGNQAKILKLHCRTIGIPEIQFHTLRACFATQLISTGVEPIKVMKICGWKDLKTMAYYMRLTGVEENGATEGLDFIHK
ncbi:MAG: hypothetical protein CME62_14955 [Halobacteriovoraceae bacterium]|nr:hypothetical protein [Halobacteriovoraceae bacterium]|tara:strand:+ start:616 stop:1713 length:1098 start_codon:yes stop_codon:yes gene_type:complete